MRGNRLRRSIVAVTGAMAISVQVGVFTGGIPCGAAAPAAPAAGAGSDNYALFVKEGGRKWGGDHDPIFVDILCDKPEAKPALLPVVKECFSAWEKASEGRISFVVKERKSLAEPPNWVDSDIVVDFVDRSLYTDPHSLWARAQRWSDEKKKNGPFEKAVIDIFIAPPPGGKSSDADLKRSLMCEIGRALGLPSSAAKTDIMNMPTTGGAGPAALSARDTATLRKIYEGYKPNPARQISIKGDLEQPGTNLSSSYLNDVSRRLTKGLAVAGDEDDEVTVSFLIKPDGQVTDEKITVAGPDYLQDAVIKAVKSVGQFKPVLNKDGTPGPSARMNVKVTGEGVLEIVTPEKNVAAEKPETKAAMGAWVNKITDLIKSNWKPTTQASFDVAVKVRVLPDGKLHDVRVVKSSGSAAADISVVRACYETSLPPFPPETGLPFAEVEVGLEQKKQQ